MRENLTTAQCYQAPAEIAGLFEELGITYLRRCRVDWEPLSSIPLDQSPYYLTNQAEFDHLEKIYGPAIEAAEIAPIYIKKIDDDIGFGVFAAENIESDAFIGEYAGVVQISGKYTHCFQSESGYESDYSWYFPDKLEDAPPLEINGRFAGNEMRFVNHGHSPNLRVEHTLHQNLWIIFFVAARDIEEDEELLIDYGEAYWQESYRADRLV